MQQLHYACEEGRNCKYKREEPLEKKDVQNVFKKSGRRATLRRIILSFKFYYSG